MPSAGVGTMRVNLPGLMTIALCAMLWEALVRGGVVNYAYLPAPSAILSGLYTLILSEQFWRDVGHTLQAVIIGWAIASVIGLALGLLLGVSPLLRKYSLASIEVLRPMPAIAFVPVALLLFGFSLKTELVVIVLPALWPVLINTMGGISTIHRRLFDVAATFRLSRASSLRKIVLPAALPPILVGLRLSLTLALVLAIVAEMVGNPTGLGYAVVRDQQALQPALMFANVIFIGVLGIVLNQALLQISWRLFPAASRGVQR
ncbi:MAG TPA: ABC transporter permease [Pseudolabrys sp.]|nr:ABC transporter permease [Pseudolabrys sp.]